MYYRCDQRPSLSADGWYMVWMLYAVNMITGDECGPSFLTFVLWLKENLGRNLNQEIHQSGDRNRDRWMRGNEVTLRPQLWSILFGWTLHLRFFFFLTGLTVRYSFLFVSFASTHLQKLQPPLWFSRRGPGFDLRSGHFPSWGFSGVFPQL